ncbi:MAG: hypothetical protein J2P17_36140 [Mycobacterium sp.]|nr:hypothetical protein [Mycobacterium sp.]
MAEPTQNRCRRWRIGLPPFLTSLLQEVIDSHDHQQVFTTPEGNWYRWSNFARRL